MVTKLEMETGAVAEKKEIVAGGFGGPLCGDPCCDEVQRVANILRELWEFSVLCSSHAFSEPLGPAISNRHGDRRSAGDGSGLSHPQMAVPAAFPAAQGLSHP